MRLKNSHTLLAVALVLVALVLAATVLEASAARPGRGWRSTRYGRGGAEIWAEFPRVTFATGAGYREEFDVTEGLGFGFGMMWGVSDNIAFEGRMLQTNHTVGAGEEKREWDLDLIKVGARFSFFEEYRFQPFVGAGWAKLTLERDTGYDSSDPFERLTGYGAYVTLGVDYIHSSAWSAFLRADYTHGGYGHHAVGLTENALDDPLSGNCASVTVGIAYRIPAW
ncbi:MAG: outer membrane beta-barrel protein [Candidatus Eisenbacteria bacterium]